MKLKTTFIFFFLVTLGLSACKKDRPVISDKGLIDQWRELGLTTITRDIAFFDDTSFELTIGYPDQAPTLLKGKYRTKIDSLNVTIFQVPQSRQTMNSIAPSSILYEDATYAIKGDTLTINYTSYPADAPVASVAKFRRSILID